MNRPSVASTDRELARSGSTTEYGAPALTFAVIGADVLDHAAAPALRFDLVVDAHRAEIRSLSLNVQLRIAAQERGYDGATGVRLHELFGAPSDWARNVRSLFWLEKSVVVPAFTGQTLVELRVPCGYDFDVSAAKYLEAVRDGCIPLEFLFSGSVFYTGPGGALRTVRLPSDREARFAMPASLWRRVLEQYYPDSAWLRVSRDVFERLNAFRSRQSPPTWDAALEKLLAAEDR